MASTTALPPGPWKLPLIGSMHHMAKEVPHRALANLAREHGPVMHMQLGEVDFIVISSREAAKEVLKTQDATFAHRPQLSLAKAVFYNGSDIGFSSGLLWRELRKMCMGELLGPNRVKSFAPIRTEEMHAVLKDISNAPPGTPVDLSAQLMSVSNSIVCRSTFGNKFEHKDKFLSLVKEVVDLAVGFNISDVFPSLSFLDIGTSLRLSQMHQDLDMILEDVLQERLRQKPNKAEGEVKKEEDLIDVLLRARDQPDLEVPITNDICKAVILDMFVAGTETSSTTVAWAMLELMKNPEKMVKVQDEVRALIKRKGKMEVDAEDMTELSYLKLVIKETLRLHPPAPLLIPRECRQQSQLFGYTIPVRSRVVVNAWYLGRDPRYWDNAETFYPERFANGAIDFKGANFELVPFGAGRRICPGMGFGLASIETILAKLLFHFDWRLPNGMRTPDDLDVTENFSTGGLKEPLRLVPKIHVAIP